VKTIAISELESVIGGADDSRSAPGSIFEQSKDGVSWSDRNWRARPGGDATPVPGKIYNGSDGKQHALV